MHRGSGAVLALYVYQVGSGHRRPTQAQAPIIRLPRIASLPGAHRHFRVMQEAGIIRAMQRRYDLTKKHDLYLYISIDTSGQNSNGQMRPAS
jgi:hypothetical protein